MTTPPPAATGDEELLNSATRFMCDGGLEYCEDMVERLAAALRQRGEELAAANARADAEFERATRFRTFNEVRRKVALKKRVEELEAALSAATARAEEAEADLLSHLSTGRCVLIYSQKDLDAATDAKREACAKVCDGIAEKCEFVDSEASAEYISGARDCAAAIRARQARG